MSTKSVLRIKQGLIWEVKNPIPYKINYSPEFLLLNSIWRLEVDLLSGRDRETHDVMFQINLRNLCEVQPLQPFEVATYIEDRNNCVQMKCSSYSVTSKVEILFKASFFSLCKKLPGFSISGDLIILFVISASTELGLNVKSVDEAPKSKLTLTKTLMWDTKKPVIRQPRTSPLFSLMNSNWKLELNLANSKIAFHSAYQVSLRSVAGARSLLPVEVRTFLEHREHIVQYRCSRSDGASSTGETLYRARFDSIFVDADALENYDDMTVVCIFNPSTGLALNVTQPDIEVLMDCSLCHNRGCFLQEYVAPGPAASKFQSVTFLPNYESLSADLSKLMDKSLMSDIKLQCGETVIAVHKAILIARSEVFLTMIKDEINANRNGVVDIKDIEPLVLRLFLKYLYAGTIPDVLSGETVYKLYVVSYAYAVEGLQKMCRCYLSRNLNEENYIDFLMLASAHEDELLKDAVSEFVIRNSVLMKNENWTRFAKEFPQIADDIHSKYITTALSNVRN